MTGACESPASRREKCNALRVEYRARRRAIDKDEKANRDALICKYATLLASFRFAENVLIYAPLEDEPDVLPIAIEALRQGKHVAFPKADPNGHTMEFHFVSDLSELTSQAMGIMEPSSDAQIYIPEDDDGCSVCFVPGLLYDRGGYRLGYGGGYYDRYLPRFRGCKVGICYTDFIIDRVPRSRFDIKCDIMLTEKNVRIPNEN